MTGGQLNQARTINQKIEIHQAAISTDAVGAPNNLGRSGAATYVGRHELLDELYRRLSPDEQSPIVSIRGMGGVGKSELALQYALRYGQLYNGGMCLLRAREPLGLQVIAFAKSQLDLEPPANVDQADQVAYCWRHWRPGKVLVIFDNVQQHKRNRDGILQQCYKEDIDPFLPPSEARFKVLMTTRDELGSSFSEFHLGLLSRSESSSLLRSLAGDERFDAESETLEWLCDWVGDLPLGFRAISF